MKKEDFPLYVVVYGTLKRTYGNNVRLSTSTFVSEVTVPGYKLVNAGFPVAFHEKDSTIRGELWEITKEGVVESLDRLESEGTMYNRESIVVKVGDKEIPAQMYVGNEKFWSYSKLDDCKKNDAGEFFWSRTYGRL